LGNLKAAEVPIREEDIRIQFKTYGGIKNIKINSKQDCAFVTFFNRFEAEIAAETLYQRLIINKAPIKILVNKILKKKWAKSKNKKDTNNNEMNTNEEKEDIEKKRKLENIEYSERVLKKFKKSEDEKLELFYPPGSKELEKFTYPSMNYSN
jgi:hypothetical protein